MEDSTFFSCKRSLQIHVLKSEVLTLPFFLDKHQNYVVFSSANAQCFLRAKKI